MKRIMTILACMGVLFTAGLAHAERLEVALLFTPTVHQDTRFETFSSENLATQRIGLDLRTEVASIAGFKLLPFVGYSYSRNGGSPLYDTLDTNLHGHEFAGGLRVRKGVFSWLAAFVEIEGGLLLTDMDADVHTRDFGSDRGSSNSYTDRQYTWSAGGMAGFEVGMPKKVLRRKGNDWFAFSGELAGGYLRRGDLTFTPKLQGGDEHSLAVADSATWGTVNLSGWTVQIGVSLKFW